MRKNTEKEEIVKKVPTGRHARTVGTHTGKFGAESVRAALRRVRGSAPNFVPRDCEAEARPADETAEAEQGQRSAFCKPAATGAAKAGNRNHQGEGISVPRMRAEMGPPWSVSFFDTLKNGRLPHCNVRRRAVPVLWRPAGSACLEGGMVPGRRGGRCAGRPRFHVTFLSLHNRMRESDPAQAPG